MNHIGDLLAKHRNIFLVLLLAAALAAGGYANQKELAARSTMVNIPVTETLSQQRSPLETYKAERDASALADIAALEKLLGQAGLDDQTREQAAGMLQTIIDARQSQLALEGALTGSSLYPCVAVVQGGSVTIVTEKSTITKKDSALVWTLADAHAGIPPEKVRIITAE